MKRKTNEKQTKNQTSKKKIFNNKANMFVCAINIGMHSLRKENNEMKTNNKHTNNYTSPPLPPM